MSDDSIKIGSFYKDDQLLLTPHPNGGWVVSSVRGYTDLTSSKLGAYSTAADMIDALSSALIRSDEREE